MHIFLFHILSFCYLAMRAPILLIVCSVRNKQFNLRLGQLTLKIQKTVFTTHLTILSDNAYNLAAIVDST